MLKAFQNQVEENFGFLKKGKLYLAISGGKDSMVLSHLLKDSGLQHTLLHCNFKLRGRESDEDQEFVEKYAGDSALEVQVRSFETEEKAVEFGMNIQEAARKLRYEWFQTFLAEDDAYLLTGHHLDDSIETFFINLLRGTGIKGLGGIQTVNEKIVRPLSNFKVGEIYKYIDDEGIAYRKDSSNDEQKYRRNKLRNSFLPELRELEPQFQQKMNSLFLDVNLAMDYMTEEAKKLKLDAFKTTDERTTVSVQSLKNIHPYLLQFAFSEYGIYRKNLPELQKLITAESGAKIRFGEYILLKDRDQIIISRQLDEPFYEVMISSLPTTLDSPIGKLNLEQKTFEGLVQKEAVQQFEIEHIVLPLCLRKWQAGDKIRPLGMSGNKLISDILIDKKVDNIAKESKLVLQNGSGNLLALLGMVLSDDYKVTETTREILEVSITS